ncbi:cortex morphogenetic protein CmpA [Alicyclobacillus cellulosilyticus]|nr:cortex morphogenetic protein CmpA [Alicyclobacillus cellulosilyticus]
MPEWLQSQLRRAFFNHDTKSIQMLNEAFFRYRDKVAEPRQAR